ncbi:MAG TPA: hypothetical protein VFP57_04985 [Sphingomicrobium sp.]|jgi:hypothetical protein|nr:hypothetical protein [Sphingomicrobium sp.]
MKSQSKKADGIVRTLRDKVARLGPGVQPRPRDAVAYAAALEILG